MQIENVYDTPSRDGLYEATKYFPEQVQSALATLRRRILSGRIDHSGRALPIDKADVELLSALVVALKAQQRDRVRLGLLLALNTNGDLMTDHQGRMFTAVSAKRQIGQLPALQARLEKVCSALTRATTGNDFEAYIELRAQAATYLADRLYMHTYCAGGYDIWKASFPGDTLTTGLKRGAPGRLDTILALSAQNFTRDSGYWVVQKTAEAIQGPLERLLSDGRLDTVPENHLLLQPETGYTHDQLKHMLSNAKAISQAYQEKSKKL